MTGRETVEDIAWRSAIPSFLESSGTGPASLAMALAQDPDGFWGLAIQVDMAACWKALRKSARRHMDDLIKGEQKQAMTDGWEDPQGDIRRHKDHLANLYRTRERGPSDHILCCSRCLGQDRISLIPQDCTRHRHERGETLVCPEGHVVFYAADYGEMDIGIIPNSTGSNS